jgi:hypothetical protein
VAIVGGARSADDGGISDEGDDAFLATTAETPERESLVDA